MARAGRRRAALAAALLLAAPSAEARVVRIEIDEKVSPAFNGTVYGEAGTYETYAGRAFGELDPRDPANAVIQDLALAPRNARGLVEYMATFFLAKPVDLARSSRLMWHDVPNRGLRLPIPAAERLAGDIGLSSGWQGDNSGQSAHAPGRDYAVVPVARNPDGSPVTGQVLGRIANAAGPASRRMFVHSSPLPYRPASLDTRQARLSTVAWEAMDGTRGPVVPVAPEDWAWARCDAGNPFPGTPDPTQICLRRGFDPALLYEVVFTAQDPPVLGIGYAAFRDVAAFFRFAERDDSGTPNPVARGVSWAIARGVSQSGNFIRGFIHLGFNRDEAGRQVFDGAWPIVAARRVALNQRFALPDGQLRLFELGSEGPLWWARWPDPVRGLGPAGLLDRCSATGTCPKVIEHYGAAEVWGLKLSPAWVGTAADADIPLPESVRSYYLPGAPHGGGPGGFSTDALPPPVCPSVGTGRGTLPGNPLPYLHTVNALRAHFRAWVMKGTPPPPSRYPTLAAGLLVEPTREAMGFPRIPGLQDDLPGRVLNPLLDYDLGPGFDARDASGIVSVVPPRVRRAIKTLVPRVDADGNELGGVPLVLRDAPLGTYVGWNVVADGFHRGKACDYAGGMIPFARSRAERVASGDPRLSLEERYGSHAGYVEAVRKAAEAALAQGFLLPADAAALVRSAAASEVLR